MSLSLYLPDNGEFLLAGLIYMVNYYLRVQIGVRRSMSVSDILARGTRTVRICDMTIAKLSAQQLPKMRPARVDEVD